MRSGTLKDPVFARRARRNLGYQCVPPNRHYRALRSNWDCCVHKQPCMYATIDLFTEGRKASCLTASTICPASTTILRQLVTSRQPIITYKRLLITIKITKKKPRLTPTVLKRRVRLRTSIQTQPASTRKNSGVKEDTPFRICRLNVRGIAKARRSFGSVECGRIHGERGHRQALCQAKTDAMGTAQPLLQTPNEHATLRRLSERWYSSVSL